jgi:outer membrane protein assembly factor BamB
MLLVQAWIVPSTARPTSSQLGYLGNYTITFTKPDGTTFDWKSTSNAFPDGTMWTTIVPDQVGNWTAVFKFGGATVLGNILPPANSPVTYFTVQLEPLAGYPWQLSQLPTDYWTYPINSEHREWYSIAGDWPVASYNASKTNFNPWTQGPNSSHILWDMKTAISGIQGGYSSDSNYGKGEYIAQLGISYIAQGMGYMNAPDGVHCIDMATGKTLWIAPGSINNIDYAQARSEAGSAEEIKPSLIPMSIGSNLVQYNPVFGTVTLNQTGFLSATQFVPPWAYSVVNYGSTSNPNYHLVCWSPANTANLTLGLLSTGSYSLDTATLYNVTWPFTGITCIGTSTAGNDVGVFVYRDSVLPGWVGGADLVTGKLLWNSTMSWRSYSSSATCAAYGKVITVGDNGYWDCFDLASGKKVWTSETPVYPYGFAWAYSAAAAYGNFYGFCYNGVYCYDSNTGKIKWVFNLGNSNGETPYNTWPYDAACALADGKLYITNSIHTAPPPLERGMKLACIDANTGKQLWNISQTGSGFSTQGTLVADGYLVSPNLYDGILYCFSKGLTATTVTAPDVVIPQGNGVVIKGTVMDQSPAQPGTPCVSKESMTTQMEYLHMQMPIDGMYHNFTMTGVPVTLTAIDSAGKVINIGTATTSAYYGTFEMAWTPPAEGTYKIIASFAGDDSYGSSGAATAVSVSAAPTTSAPQTVVPDYNMTIIAAAIAIITAVAIVGLLIFLGLRKR